jgi:XXXCH domain-containing protein
MGLPKLFGVAARLFHDSRMYGDSYHRGRPGLKEMPLKEKLEQTLSREALAALLEALAAELRAGTLAVEGTQWSLPPTVETRIEVKEKKGRIRHKLEWRCSTLENYESEAVEEVTRWHSNLRDAKKGMARAFKELKKAVAAGGLSDEALLMELERHSAAFLELAEPEWRHATEEFMDHLGNLRTAWRLGHGEIVQHELRDLETRMVSCHRDLR